MRGEINLRDIIRLKEVEIISKDSMLIIDVGFLKRLLNALTLSRSTKKETLLF